MRILIALAAAAVLSCAGAKAPSCIDLSGTYTLAAQPIRSNSSSDFIFSEGLALKTVQSMTIVQPGCTVQLHATANDGTGADIVLEHDLDWTPDGVTASWSAQKTRAVILSSATTRTRSLTLRLSPERDLLTVSSEFDERGLALLFMPFHNHETTTCVMRRTKS